MTAPHRRRFLLATATTATVGPAAAAVARRKRDRAADDRERPARTADAADETGADRDDDAGADADDEPTGCDDRTADGRDGSKAKRGADADDPASAGDGKAGKRVTFLDCGRVRIVGDYADVILSIAFDSGDGAVGTIVEPVGGVDGERTIDAAAEFDLDPETTVLAAVELFETEGVATPGLGDLRAVNPDEEACLAERLGHLDGVDG
ncbi:hypothetical protein [Salinilacihabitans rarus]|uniref:hypothetical protein n=1 Tax=Salinilacihabitans rarus TaxID=2961596 RepID=UPI0020C8E9E2|nr:hypothetical protein [Salinilacihabitans rarus]